jgi:hypothetical protein
MLLKRINSINTNKRRPLLMRSISYISTDVHAKKHVFVYLKTVQKRKNRLKTEPSYWLEETTA